MGGQQGEGGGDRCFRFSKTDSLALLSLQHQLSRIRVEKICEFVRMKS